MNISDTRFNLTALLFVLFALIYLSIVYLNPFENIEIDFSVDCIKSFLKFFSICMIIISNVPFQIITLIRVHTNFRSVNILHEILHLNSIKWNLTFDRFQILHIQIRWQIIHLWIYQWKYSSKKNLQIIF